MSAVTAGCKETVAVFVHVHFLDVWDEMAGLLAERMSVPFRLIVTTPHGPDRITVPDTPLLAGCDVRPLANRGRDILPFLIALEGEHAPFAIGLKLHTKRSLHRSDGDAWRRAILDSLLPSPDGIGRITMTMRSDPRIGLVAPKGLFVPLKGRTGENRALMEAIAMASGAPLYRRDLRKGYFAAGSMFWFRRDALAGLSASRLASFFTEEAGQLDATAAHAIERLFGLFAERRGFIAVPVDVLADVGPERTLGEARRLARSTARRLSPFVWQLPRALMIVRRLVPLTGWAYRRLPSQLRLLVRRALGGDTLSAPQQSQRR